MMHRVLAVTAALLLAGCATEPAGSDRPRPPLTDSYVGAPEAADGTGAVEVRLTSGERHMLTPPNPRPGMRFGAAVWSGQLIEIENRSSNFLLVGAPGLTVEGKTNAGGIFVFERTGKTYRYLDLITQDDVMVRRPLTEQATATRWQVQAGAEFGAAMDGRANEDFGATPVYVGVPGLDVADAKAAGGVVVLNLTRYVNATYLGKLSDVHGELHTLVAPGSPRPPGRGDRLGTTVTTTWWGAPGATVGGQPGAGLVVGPPDQSGRRYGIYHLGKDGLPGPPAAGDGLGSLLAEAPDADPRVWIGVPGRDVDDARDAGMVVGLRESFADGDSDGGRNFEAGPVYTENDVDGAKAEPSDHFGAALCGYTLYDRDRSTHKGQPASMKLLLVGAPGKDVDGVPDAGMVVGLFDAPSVTADTVGGELTAGARFGGRLSCGGNSTEGVEVLIGASGIGGRDGVAGMVGHGVHRRGEDSITWDQWTPRDGRLGDAYGTSLGFRGWY